MTISLEDIKNLSGVSLKKKLGDKYLSHRSLDVNRYSLASKLGYSTSDLEDVFGNVNMASAPSSLRQAIPAMNFTQQLESRFWVAPEGSIPFVHPTHF
jgi:hypothetical protein